MKRWKRMCMAAGTAVVVVGCGGDKSSPTAPATPATPATVSAPAIDAPAMDTQLDTLRPVLSVKNAASTQTGVRTYEFQVSDSNVFNAATTSNVPGFAATVSATAVAPTGTPALVPVT